MLVPNLAGMADGTSAGGDEAVGTPAVEIRHDREAAEAEEGGATPISASSSSPLPNIACVETSNGGDEAVETRAAESAAVEMIEEENEAAGTPVVESAAADMAVVENNAAGPPAAESTAAEMVVVENEAAETTAAADMIVEESEAATAGQGALAAAAAPAPSAVAPSWSAGSLRPYIGMLVAGTPRLDFGRAEEDISDDPTDHELGLVYMQELGHHQRRPVFHVLWARDGKSDCSETVDMRLEWPKERVWRLTRVIGRVIFEPALEVVEFDPERALSFNERDVLLLAKLGKQKIDESRKHTRQRPLVLPSILERRARRPSVARWVRADAAAEAATINDVSPTALQP